MDFGDEFGAIEYLAVHGVSGWAEIARTLGLTQVGERTISDYVRRRWRITSWDVFVQTLKDILLNRGNQ